MSLLRYAFRQVFSPRRRGIPRFANKRIVGAVAGMVLSLIPVCVAIVVVDGMVAGISDRFLSLGDAHIKIYSYTVRSRPAIQTAMETALRHPRVNSVIPSVNGRGLLSNSVTRQKTGVAIKGFRPDFLEQDADYRRYLTLTEGQWSLNQPKDILVSDAAAAKLGLHAGDGVDLLMVVHLGGVDRPITGRYTVRGIFSTGYYQLDNISVYMNLDRIYPLFKEKGVQLYVKVDNPHHQIDSLTQELRSAVNENAYWQLSNWKTNNRTFFQSLEDTQFLILMVLIGILFITGFNIMSTFFMAVKEKEKEIAILKCCGVSGGTLTLSFVLSAFLLALIGTVVGLGCGLLVAMHINEILAAIEWGVNLFASGRSFHIINPDYYLETIPVHIEPGKIALIGAASLLIAFFFTLIPVAKINKIKPIEVIRRH